MSATLPARKMYEKHLDGVIYGTGGIAVPAKIVDGANIQAFGSEQATIALDHELAAGTYDGEYKIYGYPTADSGRTLLKTIAITSANNTDDTYTFNLVGKWRAFDVELTLNSITSIKTTITSSVL